MTPGEGSLREGGIVHNLEGFATLNHGDTASALAHASVPLQGALYALQRVTTGFDVSGNGNVDFWMKTTRDFALWGQLPTLSEGGHGNVHYWMARAESVASMVQGAGNQLYALANGAGAETAPLAAVVAGLGHVAGSVDYSGEGNADYWMRTTRNFCFLGRAVGRGLDAVASFAPPALQGLLGSYAGQLQGLSEAGTGNVHYWMARAQDVAEHVRSVGQALKNLAPHL